MTTLRMAQRMTMATMTLAQQRARGAVKAEIRKHGIRLSEIAAKDISSWAQVYLEDHAEIVAKAKSIVDLWASQGRFGNRGGFR
jgi:hypothetical protein